MYSHLRPQPAQTHSLYSYRKVICNKLNFTNEFREYQSKSSTTNFLKY